MIRGKVIERVFTSLPPRSFPLSADEIDWKRSTVVAVDTHDDDHIQIDVDDTEYREQT